jgi:uncharacterized membrane protein YcaP (DUF421 family)
MELLLVIGQTLAIYLFLVIALSWVGRSLMAGLTNLDYLIVILLGSAVETGLYRGSNSLWAGLVSATTLIAADRCVSFLMNRWPRLRRWLVGGPVVVLHDGQIVWTHLRRLRLSEEDLCAAIRERGYDNLNDLHLALMETNGEIGVVPAPGVERR